MPELQESGSEIRDTDIVFDCPQCGKSLAIDYRGAGLSIPCSDCGNKVEVPIPEGMELTDLDSTGEEQEALIVNLRRSLSAAEFRVEELEAQLAALDSRRAALERSRLDGMAQDETLTRGLQTLQRLVADMQGALAEMAASLSGGGGGGDDDDGEA